MEMQTNNEEHSLDSLDKRILNIIQNEFPLASRPYEEIASMVDSSEEEVLARVKALKKKGIIRRLGGVFDSQKIGFASTLIALRVDPEKLDEVGERINSLEGVTHNYERDHHFNLWFTLVAPFEEQLEEVLAEIESYPGVEKLRNLPALQLFKIGVNFKL